MRRACSSGVDSLTSPLRETPRRAWRRVRLPLLGVGRGELAPAIGEHAPDRGKAAVQRLDQLGIGKRLRHGRHGDRGKDHGTCRSKQVHGSLRGEFEAYWPPCRSAKTLTTREMMMNRKLLASLVCASLLSAAGAFAQ